MPQDNDQINVPFVVYESAQTRMERANKRLAVALVLTIVLLFLSNALWLWYESQFEYTTETSRVEVDAGSGVANYIGNDGDITNGTDNGYNNKDNTHEAKE